MTIVGSASKTFSCEPIVGSSSPNNSPRRSYRELNSSSSNSCLTSSVLIVPHFTDARSKSTGASVRRTIASTFRLARSSNSMRFCRSFGVCSSACSKIPSRPPYALMSLAAVFSPTPGIPGRLSEGSPRRAAYCGYNSGVTPVLSTIPSSSYNA